MGFPIQRAREIAEGHMPDTCDVLRARSEIRAGRRVETDAPEVAGTYSCRIRAHRADEVVIAGQTSREARGTVLLPFGTEVRGDDQIRLGGLIYEVVAVLPRTAAYAAQEKVLVAGAGEAGEGP